MLKRIITHIRSTEYIFHKLKAHTTERQFILIAGMMIGFSAGLAAIVLKLLTHFLRNVLVSATQVNYTDYLYAAGPLVGFFLSFSYGAYFHRLLILRGASDVLYAIKRKFSLLAPHKIYSNLITASLTVGFGGSVGLEAPIVASGSALGSNFGRVYRLSQKNRTLLIACGAAGGIAAVFNAPIAGVIFSIEVLLAEVSLTAFIPLIIAAVCGSLSSMLLLNEEILLTYKHYLFFNYTNLPFYILLAVLAGLYSTYYTSVAIYIQKVFSNLKNKWLRILYGGMALGLLVILFPTLFGEGYESIHALLYGNYKQLFSNLSLFQNIGMDISGTIIIGMISILFLKVVATSITLASGGNGGNFAPSLFAGAFLGSSFAVCINESGLYTLPVANFTIVGMAAVMSGVLHAPLSAIFLIAEVTGGYELMIPLMTCSALSFAIAKHFNSISIDKRSLIGKLTKDELIH